MTAPVPRRIALSLCCMAALAAAAGGANAADPLRFVTGPFRTTEAETRAQWTPLVQYLGAQLGMEVEFRIAGDWAEVGAALVRKEADVAWMGGAWRYAVARSQGAGPAIATVKFAGSPTYHAIVIAKPSLEIKSYPADAAGRSISFTHAESTTGWLVPYAWLVQQGIDPKTYFKYADGAQHPDNVLRVASGEFDLATDHDNNRNRMIASGAVKADATKVVWTSDPVPQDPVAVRVGIDPALARRIQQALVSIDAAQVESSPMPPGYTGFVTATDETYRGVYEAGVATGRIKRAAPR